MTVARRQLIDLDLTRYNHGISRFVHRAFLCGEGFEHRKAWIEERLETMAKISPSRSLVFRPWTITCMSSAGWFL